MEKKELTQTELHQHYMFYCQNGSLAKLKKLHELYDPIIPNNIVASLFLKISQRFKKPLRIEYLEYDGFIASSEYGHDHIVKYYLEDRGLKDQKIITQACFKAIGNGHLSTAKLLTPLIDDAHDNLPLASETLNNLCIYGNLDGIKYLLTEKALKIPLDKVLDLQLSKYDSPCEYFVTACERGETDIVKYLTSSHELERHVNLDLITDDFYLLEADILQHLIFELKVERDSNIMKKIKFDDKDLIEALFIKRELHDGLVSSFNDTSPTKVKKRSKI